jgi:hypothetical protein
MAKQSSTAQPADDLLWGTKAEHIGCSVRQAQYLIQEKRIPFRRLGDDTSKIIVGSRRKLDSHLRGDNSE